ncbi:MOSC domain-containing protein [Actinomycetospora endophytica]|uniref:MOSC domain-containing protein n=1 Tax=Actinomycetospora endophytica TaxID=2291215 RepID=A0ABS8PH57_9PSEU|nr:MOSC N-terminal beta barrel domain-containing protein [Actinomycetospora endophytica]MCD2197601.1 MOSC domain-containing protein [Actinomycetospora endophytica]
MRRQAVVGELGVFPVKSLRGLDVDSAEVRPWGYEGDRRWMVVDPQGRFVTQRSTPAMALVGTVRRADGLVELRAAGADPMPLVPTGPETTVSVWRDEVRAVRGSPEADRWLSTALGRDVTLVHLAHPASARPIDPDYAEPGESVSFADGFPLLVTNRASLAVLNGWQREAGARVLPMDRFRPSLVVDTDEPWAEDHWTVIAVGEVTLRLVKPCARCVMTSVVPETGTVEPGGPLRQLGRHRPGVSFGVNAIPSTTGTVRVGDEVVVLERRDEHPVSAASNPPSLRSPRSRLRP